MFVRVKPRDVPSFEWTLARNFSNSSWLSEFGNASSDPRQYCRKRPSLIANGTAAQHHQKDAHQCSYQTRIAKRNSQTPERSQRATTSGVSACALAQRMA